MAVDVVDMRAFYASPRGRAAGHIIGRALAGLWPSARGLRVLGVGYATPYLPLVSEGAERVAAFMPAAQGVVRWPQRGASATALVDPDMLPLPDAAYDRVLLVHCLEHADSPADVLSEVWRVLSPGGRLLLVAPNRRGAWARSDSTPFGHGQPWSRAQLRALMRQCLFSPENWLDALYVPPFGDRLLPRSAAWWEKACGGLGLPFAGVHVVEASKQLHRPVTVTRHHRVVRFNPVLAPEAGGALPSARRN
ncbi:class I SAM-dependent methyltransferase [Camelimonas abortus]|uniref:Class I SAM-dependent methyltransferase n=1 Tax=Camelimonas abortus TaxID=1017184 RepID=A0ABV7LC15_9HYPH